MELIINKTQNPRQKPDYSNLGFGNYFTDHMMTMEYDEGQGWHNAQIQPYGPIPLEPSANVFHYGQETFEGLKAYKTKDGKITLFRPRENFLRMNRSNERLCMPAIDVDFALESLKALIMLDSEWIPTEKETSLYIRPFMIGTEATLGVKISSSYLFAIILSPVGTYYPEGMKPTNIYVESKYIRAAVGGTGAAKSAGNYAASLKPLKEAKEKGYSQVLFLDGIERKYVEEVGTSNAFFVIDSELYTTPLESGTILAGITRDSTIAIAESQGIKVNEVPLAIDDIFEFAAQGRLEEAFATGTAAVISPIGQLSYNGNDIAISGGEIGKITQSLYDSLIAIQYGDAIDPYGWVEKVN
ncbi:MAG: branched-chain amino acid aminotransferase [Eubacteriaceae bacterium]|nr:branched-chain amino acid aminotransferase [Eubacteriaceae bacterium]